MPFVSMSTSRDVFFVFSVNHFTNQISLNFSNLKQNTGYPISLGLERTFCCLVSGDSITDKYFLSFEKTTNKRLWQNKYLVGGTSTDPRYEGPNGVAALPAVQASFMGTPAVQNTGGPGTAG